MARRSSSGLLLACLVVLLFLGGAEGASEKWLSGLFKKIDKSASPSDALAEAKRGFADSAAAAAEKLNSAQATPKTLGSQITKLEKENEMLRCSNEPQQCGKWRPKSADGDQEALFKELSLENQALMGVSESCAHHKAGYIAYTMKQRLTNGIKWVDCSQERFKTCLKPKYDIEDKADFYALSHAMNEIISQRLPAEDPATWAKWGCEKPQGGDDNCVTNVCANDDMCMVHFKDLVNKDMKETFDDKGIVEVDWRNEAQCNCKCANAGQKAVAFLEESAGQMEAVDCEKCGKKYDLRNPDEYNEVWNALYQKAKCMVAPQRTCYDFCCSNPHNMAKITCSGPEPSDSKCDSCTEKWGMFFRKLKRDNYFQGLQEGSAEYRKRYDDAKWTFEHKNCAGSKTSMETPHTDHQDSVLEKAVGEFRDEVKKVGGDDKKKDGKVTNTSGPWSMSVSEQEAKTCKAYKPLCDQCKVLHRSKLIDWELVPAGVKPNTEENKNVKEDSASASNKKQSIEKKMQNSAKQLLKDKKEALVMEKAGDILGTFGGGNKVLGMKGGDEQSSKTKSEGSSKLGSLSKFASNFGFLELKEMNESSGNDCQMKIPRCIRVGESWVDSSFTYLPKMICAVDGQPFLEIPRDIQEVTYRMEAPSNPATKGAFFTVDFVLKSEWPKALQDQFFARSVGNSVTCHTPDDLVFTGYMKGECSLVM